MGNRNPKHGLIRVQSKISIFYFYLLVHFGPLPDLGKEAVILALCRAQKAACETVRVHLRGGALYRNPQRPVAGAGHAAHHREDAPAGIESTRTLAIEGDRALCHLGGVETPDLFEDGG